MTLLYTCEQCEELTWSCPQTQTPCCGCRTKVVIYSVKSRSPVRSEEREEDKNTAETVISAEETQDETGPETPERPQNQKSVPNTNKPLWEWLWEACNFSGKNSSSAGSSGSTGSDSTGSGFFSRFSMGGLGGFFFAFITGLWNSFWADFKQEFWNSCMNWCMNCLYCSVVVLAVLLVYGLLCTNEGKKARTWFAETFAKVFRSEKHLNLEATKKDLKNREVNHRTVSTILTTCTYLFVVLGCIMFVDIVVRGQDSLWIIMSTTWDHFIEEKACDYFTLEPNACWRVVPDFLFRTLMPETLYRLVTDCDRKSFWLMLVGLVGCVGFVSWLVYLIIWDIKKSQHENYKSWNFWVRQTNANPANKKDSKTLKAESDKLLKESRNVARHERRQSHLKLWNEGEYLSYIFIKVNDFISWILGSSWKLSSCFVKWTIIIVVVVFVLFHFFPETACAATPWCAWKTVNIPNDTNSHFGNQSQDSFADGPPPDSQEGNDTGGAHGTDQSNTADGQTDDQANTKTGQPEGQPEQVKSDFDWIKWLTGNEEAKVTEREATLRNVAHFFVQTRAQLLSTFSSWSMDTLKNAAVSKDKPFAGASDAGNAQNPAQDQSKPAEPKTDKPEEGKTEEVKTEEVKTEEVETEKVKTEEVKTEEVKTEEGKPDEEGLPLDFFTTGVDSCAQDKSADDTAADTAAKTAQTG